LSWLTIVLHDVVRCPPGVIEEQNMLRPQPSKQTRNKAQSCKNSAKIERFLTEFEKAHGCAKSWEMRERLESGDLTLKEMLRR